jgi:hypothetical protein
MQCDAMPYGMDGVCAAMLIHIFVFSALQLSSPLLPPSLLLPCRSQPPPRAVRPLEAK